MSVIYPALYIGGIGFVLAVILAVASRVFEVSVDERVQKVEEVLPGANCGACGYPGCSGFAQAVVNGEAPINGCIPGGEKVATQIAEILGQKVEKVEKKVARLKCYGGSKARDVAQYYGVQDCRAAMLVFSAGKECPYGCLGLGTCVQVCPFGAIEMGEDKLPRIDIEKCTGCGVCVRECPKGVLELVPLSKPVFVGCSSKDIGKVVRDYCEAGCVACRICEKVCPVGAIKVENNVAVINYELCISCGLCVEKCPRKIIKSLRDHKSLVAEIDREKCVGCTICKKNCKFDAIEGEVKQPHKVLPDKCVACGVCIEKCPKDAIRFVKRS